MSCDRTFSILLRVPIAAFVLAAILCALRVEPAAAAPVWPMYAGDAQHHATAYSATQPLQRIRWSTPVDLQPQYASGQFLLIHYGSPLCTEVGTMLVAVKTGVADSFRIEARNPDDGTLLWLQDSDYTQPPHNWAMPFGSCLTPSGRLYMPGAGGTVYYADGLDSPVAPAFTQLAFYGNANYNVNQPAYDSDIKISSPLTSDANGNIFFLYRATGANPLGITHGLARIDANGTGNFVTTNVLADSVGTNTLFNATPALSLDGSIVYTAVRLGAQGSASPVPLTHGWLVAADATTLAPLQKTYLMDPRSGRFANPPQDGTSSPMVGPDGRIYMGVLERGISNGQRGWMLQFNPDFTSAGVAGAFGWDDTPSMVPRTMVPSYAGSSEYLLMTKYNFYAGGGGIGDGTNRIAILDPNDSEPDPHTGFTVMKEVMTILGPTPDPQYFPTYPNAVREWCINTAVVDTFTRTVLANCEDGFLHRWDMATNSFTESIQLTNGIGEAYTPTMSGKDGAVYAINDAVLFCVGQNVATSVDPLDTPGSLRLAAARPTPFADATTLSFRLPQGDRARIDILDISGRLITTIVDRDLPAGEHAVRWTGQTRDGAPAPAGVYLARLTAGKLAVSRRLVLTR